MNDDAPPAILRVLEPLVAVAEGVEDIAYLIRQDGRLIGMLAAYTRQHGVAGLIKWLESPGDAV